MSNFHEPQPGKVVHVDFAGINNPTNAPKKPTTNEVLKEWKEFTDKQVHQERRISNRRFFKKAGLTVAAVGVGIGALFGIKAAVDRIIMSIDTSKEEGLRDRAILELLFSTGLRVSELVSLNKDKINLDRKEFGIIGKGNKQRIVFVSERSALSLKRYLDKRKDIFKPLFIRYSGKIIVDNNGEKMRLTSRSVERMVKKYVRVSRIPVDATVHTFRHSFATDLLTNGADIRAVQEMLGHKNIATTQIYTHITNRQLRDVHKSFHSGNKK